LIFDALYSLLDGPLILLTWSFIPFEMVQNYRRPIHEGHGGPVLGQDHGSGPATAPLPAETIASACSFSAAASGVVW